MAKIVVAGQETGNLEDWAVGMDNEGQVIIYTGHYPEEVKLG